MKNFLRVFVVAICVLLPLSSVAQNQRSDDDRRPNQGYGISHDRWQGRLSTENQSRFDSITRAGWITRKPMIETIETAWKTVCEM